MLAPGDPLATESSFPIISIFVGFSLVKTGARVDWTVDTWLVSIIVVHVYIIPHPSGNSLYAL